MLGKMFLLMILIVGVGAFVFSNSINEETLKVITDPYKAVATGGGIIVDSSGYLRFVSGGYVKTTDTGEIIPASFEQGGN